jgi:hypothetical protein
LEQFSPRAIGIGKLNIRRHALRNLSAKEIFMTSKEAELLFNQEQLPGSGSPTPEYEQRALAERTKIAKLRALRLAREAERVERQDCGGSAGGG